MMGTLYLVATPIGNLEDMTLRGLRVLREVELVACEDTRSARRLLDQYEITGKRLTSYTDHNKRAKTPQILRALEEGDVALVSDAGMPGISDPGYDLVVAATEAGHAVTPIPGATALTLAVAASGLPSRRFYYLGFLPREAGPRRRALKEAAATGDTLVVYESPHRVQATLRDVREALGERRVAVCRELTKLHEEIWRGTVSGALEHFASPRGEFTLVIEGGAAPVDKERDAAELGAVVSALRATGATTKDAIAELQRTAGLSRREAYRVWHSEA